MSEPSPVEAEDLGEQIRCKLFPLCPGPQHWSFGRLAEQGEGPLACPAPSSHLLPLVLYPAAVTPLSPRRVL